MKTLFLSLFALLCVHTTFAQQKFIKSFSGPMAGKYTRVAPAAQKGWVVFSLDSLTLTKYSDCGLVEWNKRYRHGSNYFSPGFSDFIRVSSGGYAFLSRLTENDKSDPVVTRLDEQGNVLWSKKIGDDHYNHYTYTLQEDKAGNMVLFGNVSKVNTNETHSMVCKINAAGEMVWSRFYSHGIIWGAAIITSDNGILVRTGNTFFKTDANGIEQWTYWVSPGSQEGYTAAVEVQDGFIFTTISPGTEEVNFHKLDKQGNGLWNGRRHSNLRAYGWHKRLWPLPNGNVAGIFVKAMDSQRFSVLLEFDKDLQVIRQSAPKPAQAGAEFLATGFCLLENNAPILTGQVVQDGDIAGNFVAKAGSDLSFSCDTLLPAFSYVLEPVSQSFTATTSFAYPLFSSNQPATFTSFDVEQADICIISVVAELSLGADTLLCPGTSTILLPLSASVFEGYTWSNGETSQTISVSSPGIYSVQAFYNCGQSFATDTITIGIKQIPEPDLVADSSFCASDVILLDASLPEATYLWSTGSTAPQISVSEPGTYFVDITFNGCTNRYASTLADCEVLEIPNVFTPNGDGINDNFVPRAMRGITSAELKVFNRWGKEVFSTVEVKQQGWDGKTGSSLAPGGIYYYSLRYTSFQNHQREVKGYLELLTD